MSLTGKFFKSESKLSIKIPDFWLHFINYPLYIKFFFFILALQNPEVVALRGGLNTILKNVIDCQLSRINEALITTILHLLNHPKTRQYVRADVELEVGTLIFFLVLKYDFKYILLLWNFKVNMQHSINY